MPKEIADSDAESESYSPHRPSASPISEDAVNLQPPCSIEYDPLANLEFDQFLSPTQRISSAAEKYDASQPRLPSSTDRFLQSITRIENEVSDHSAASLGFDGSMEDLANTHQRYKPKRTFSDIEGDAHNPKQDGQSRAPSNKRAKTYGSSRSHMSDEVDFDHNDFRKHVQNKTKFTEYNTSAEMSVQQLRDPGSYLECEAMQTLQSEDKSMRQHTEPRTSLVSNLVQNASITKSSMGGYRGINLDFRGAGLDLNSIANPFGRLSQSSQDEEFDLGQPLKFANHYHENLNYGSQSTSITPVEAVSWHSGRLKQMTTSPLAQSVQNELPGIADGATESEVAFGNEDHPIPIASQTNDILTDGAAETCVVSVPKKRGRKPKSTHYDDLEGVTHHSSQLQDEKANADALIGQQILPSDRPRIGTVDSEDELAGRTLQSRGQEHRDALAQHPTPVVAKGDDKSKSSDLNLSDPAMIGIAKEMYVPRPSKSRSKKVSEQNEQTEAENDTKPEKAGAVADTHIAESVPSASSKKKSGRKSKVKRAKTSAAALLKSQAMYDEEDKDCIIVDEVPSKVKMSPLPDLNQFKDEQDEAKISKKQETITINAKGSEAVKDVPPSEVKISVDIPKLARPENGEDSTEKPQPKKRGRKPKKKAEVYIEEEIVQEASLEREESGQGIAVSCTRPPLSEKNGNNNTPTTSLSTNTSTENTSSKAQQQQQQEDPRQTSTDLENIVSPPLSKPVHSPLKVTLKKHVPSSSSSIIIKTSTTTTTPTSISTSTSSTNLLWSKPRVGLSKRLSIPSLLRKLDRTREPPKLVERKEKLSKRQQEEEEKRKLEAEDRGEEYDANEKWELRGKDGMLVEWDH